MNVIADKPVLEDEYLFSDPDFEEIVAFLDSADRTENVFSARIEKNGKQFNVRLLFSKIKILKFTSATLPKLKSGACLSRDDQ